MKNLKLVLIYSDKTTEELLLPEAVNELFINNKKSKEDAEWVLNIGDVRINGLTEDTNLNFGKLKNIWQNLSEKIKQNLIASIEIYNNDYLVYTINNIKSISYVIDLAGNGLGERIGINFDYDE